MKKKNLVKKRISLIIFFGVILGLVLSFFIFSYILTGNIIGDFDSNLVAHYSFDFNSNDSSGNNHHGILFEVDSVLGVVENAYYFNGSAGNVTIIAGEETNYLINDINASIIKIPASPQFDFSNQYTISAWINIGGMEEIYNEGIERKIFGIVGKDSNEGWGINIMRDNETKNYSVQVDAHSCGNFMGKTQLEVGKWYHIAVTYDDTNNENTGTIYVNGKLDTNNYSVTQANCENDFNGVVIGRYFDVNANSLNGFNGTIDNIKIYNNALGISEIRELFFEEYYCQGRIEIDNVLDLDNIYTCLGKTLVDKRDFDSCIEYDKGVDYETNSSLSSYSSIYGYSINVSDYCEGNNLVEYSCNKFYFDTYRITCLNGCTNGRCIIVENAPFVRDIVEDNEEVEDEEEEEEETVTDDDLMDSEFWESTYERGPTELSVGNKVGGYLREKERIEFGFNGDKHYVGVVEVQEGWALISVTSDVQRAYLHKGDEKSFDIDGDNIIDLNVTVKYIHNKVVSILIERVYEDLDKGVSEETNIPEEKTNLENLKIIFYLSVGIFIGLISILVILILMQPKRKRPKSIKDIPDFIEDIPKLLD